jgi:hypothetical protein
VTVPNTEPYTACPEISRGLAKAKTVKAASATQVAMCLERKGLKTPPTLSKPALLVI